MATWLDLSPRTTLPFQRTKVVKEARRVRYGQRVWRISSGLARMAMAMLMAQSTKSVELVCML